MYDVINSVNCVIDDIEISYVAANEFAFSLYERIEIGGVRFFAMNLLGQAIQNFYLVFSYGIISLPIKPAPPVTRMVFIVLLPPLRGCVMHL